MKLTHLFPEHDQTRHSRRFPAFLLAAVLLHLCAMLLVPEKLLVITEPLGDLSLSFTPSAQSPGASESQPRNERQQDRPGQQHRSRQDYLALSNDDSRMSATDTDAASKPRNPAVKPPAQPASDVPSIRRQLLGVISSSLSKHLVYPPIARQRGWQGEVRLTVDVNPVGELRNVQIARSSGHRLLDMSAKKALNDVRQVAMATDWQGRSYTNMMVPVRYQLNGQ